MKKTGKRSKIFTIQNVSLLIALVVFLLIGYLSQVPRFLFERMEAGLLDQYFWSKSAQQLKTYDRESVSTTRGNPRVSPNIVIVGIDQSSIVTLGRWPWPRAVQARVLQSASRIAFEEYRERALLMDVFYFDPSDPENDRVMAEAIRENGRVFLEPLLYGKLPSETGALEQSEARQDLLRRQFGEIGRVTGPWYDGDRFMSSEMPIPEYGSAARGYGHATYLADDDEICRDAPLVSRLARLREERDIDLRPEYFAAAFKTIRADEGKFEWIAWRDKNDEFHRIDPAAVGTPDGLETVRRKLAAEAVPLDTEGDGASQTKLRVFEDHFIPSIVLALVTEYYHKKPADVEVKFGEYVRIPDPEIYALDASDSENPQGAWRKLERSGRVQTEIKIPIDARGRMRINFMGESSEFSNTYPVLPFERFADPERIPPRDAPPEEKNIYANLQNKIAIVCAYTTAMASDEKTTPFGLMFGGEITANAINTILMESYIVEPPLWATFAIILFLVFLTALVSSRCSPLLSLVITFWHVLLYLFAVLEIFDAYNFLLNFSAPVVGMLLTFLVIVAYRVIFEEQDKRRIKGMFSKYVNPQVVEQLLVNPPELGGVDKEITVLFSDIRGYTTFSETMTPQALVNHLNVYLTEMTDILIKYYGTLDKYVGDMVMGFWGAPLPQKKHALLACQCALKQMEALRALNEGWPPEKRIDIGIGINSGIMTVGNMGSPARMNYTLIGDNVNLGSRLEGTNKNYGTNIIISEYTYGLVRDEVVVRELDNIRVKGKNKPVLIYELVDVVAGLDPPKASEVY